MTDLLADPQRWKDGVGQTNLAERRAGETIRSLNQRGPLSDLQIARIVARIRGTHPRRGHRLVPALAAFLLGIATAASAAHLNLVPSWLGGDRHKAVEMEQHPSSRVVTPRRAQPTAPAAAETTAEPAPEIAPIPAEPAPAQADPRTGIPASSPIPSAPAASIPKPMRRTVALADAPVRSEPSPPLSATAPREAVSSLHPRAIAWLAPPKRASSERPPGAGTAWAGGAPVAAPAPGASVSNPDEPEELARIGKSGGAAAKHLGEAIKLLRVARDPKSALTMLDRHASELRENSLGHEALILRVEALLVLERQDEVLRILDSAALADVAASHSLLVTRGKLRAAAHRCGEGIGDFELVLAESRQPERDALMGRAICRQRLGDVAGARADLERYRREFPADPHLPELERRLRTSP
jgi:hypothetical protein